LTYIHLVYVLSSPLTIGYILPSRRIFSGVAAELVGAGATLVKDMKDTKVDEWRIWSLLFSPPFAFLA
jgi:hypothetical protein